MVTVSTSPSESTHPIGASQMQANKKSFSRISETDEENRGIAVILSFLSVIPRILAHECSHILAARALFLDVVDPYIGCEFFESGIVCYAYVGPTQVIPPESTIGVQVRRGLVSAAGPLADLFLIASSSVASWKLRHSHPNIATTCAISALITSISLFNYSFNTLGKSWGDFASVEADLGISHRLQTVFTGAVALGSLWFTSKVFRSIEKNEEEQRERKKIVNAVVAAVIIKELEEKQKNDLVSEEANLDDSHQE